MVHRAHGGDRKDWILGSRGRPVSCMSFKPRASSEMTTVSFPAAQILLKDWRVYTSFPEEASEGGYETNINDDEDLKNSPKIHFFKCETF